MLVTMAHRPFLQWPPLAGGELPWGVLRPQQESCSPSAHRLWPLEDKAPRTLCQHHKGLVSQRYSTFDQEAPGALILPTVLGKKRHLLPRVLEPPEHHRLSSEAWKITKWHVKLPPWHIPKENSYFFSSPGDQSHYVNIWALI